MLFRKDESLLKKCRKGLMPQYIFFVICDHNFSNPVPMF